MKTGQPSRLRSNFVSISGGAGYFSINKAGDVVVTPAGADNGPSLSLHEVVKEIETRGLSMPVLLRIENILGSQISFSTKRSAR